MFRSIRTQLLMIQTSSLVLLLVIGLSAIAQVVPVPTIPTRVLLFPSKTRIPSSG